MELERNTLKNNNLSFSERCYQLLLDVPKGRVTTYKAIAEALGGKNYQAVGRAMAKNPNLISVPCHRVVHSDGRVGNYVLGPEIKQQLLSLEGVSIIDGKIDNLDRVLFLFDSRA